MRFTFLVPSQGNSSAYALSLEVCGRDPKTNAAFISVMGEHRLASIQAGELAFSRPIVLHNEGTAKIIARIALDDLPASLRGTLHALFRGGAELDLEWCESCGNLAPVKTACIKTATMCQICAARLKARPATEDESPF
jgi:hypothetical protein